jgi:hypothetical protein
MAIARLFDGLISADILESASKGMKRGLFQFDDKPSQLLPTEIVGGSEGLSTFLSNVAPEVSKKYTDNLDLAQKMFQRGEPAEDILARTGFWFDENGQIKYEIDDSQMQLMVPFEKLSPRVTMNLGDLVKHDKFFQYYPDLADTPVNFYSGNATEVGGFNLKTGEIDINTNSASLVDRDPIGAIGDLLHETQHAVQKFEKFAQGGAKEQFLRDIVTPTDKEIEKAFNQYLRLAGEAEARNVSFRYTEPKYDKVAKIVNMPSKNKVKGQNFLQSLAKDPMSEQYGVNPRQLTDSKGNVIDIRNEVVERDDLVYQDPLGRSI